jgi:hypothetical protein
MKKPALILAAVTSSVLFVALPNAAFAGNITNAPEPTTMFIWAQLAAIGGAVYWWRNRRKG